MMFKFLKSFRKPKYIIIIVLIVVGIGLFTTQSRRVNIKDITTYTVRRQTLEEVLTFSGEVDAEEKATLQFLTGGRLAWVGVGEGDYVEQYQGIASLDQRDLKKKLQQELNIYAKTRLDFDQEKQDTREVVIGALGQDERERVLRVFEQAQYDLNNAVLDVELQTIANELSYLSTPIAGLVVKAEPKHAGVIVSPATAQYIVVNPDTVVFSANADQIDVVRLREGMAGTIIFDAYPDQKVVATIASIAFIPKEGETGTVYQVQLQFTDVNDALRYRLGMTGDLEFTLRKKPNVLAIPSSYIKTENGKKYVLRITGGKEEKIAVTTGEAVDNLVEITSGLSQGDVIYD